MCSKEKKKRINFYFMENHESFMQRCIDLARLGIRDVTPNPMVGAVVVHNNRIIGEGYHRFYGKPHAEVNAIQSVSKDDLHLLSESTIYVSLEPCNHIGKTPACSELIKKSGIKKVVVACKDPFEKVAGTGIENLRSAGVEVIVGVLEKEAIELNKRFFTFHTKKRPYIILKWAQTKDGFIDKIRNEADPVGVNWITNSECKTLVHTWRSEEHAILVGNKTVLNDNPSLTTRDVIGKNPIRICIDPSLKIPTSSSILNDESSTIVLNSIKNEIVGSTSYQKLKDFNLNNILNQLYESEIQSIIVEGGRETIQQFINENTWDEARVLLGNTTFENGIPAPRIHVTPSKTELFSNTQIYYYHNK